MATDGMAFWLFNMLAVLHIMLHVHVCVWLCVSLSSFSPVLFRISGLRVMPVFGTVLHRVEGVSVASVGPLGTEEGGHGNASLRKQRTETMLWLCCPFYHAYRSIFIFPFEPGRNGCVNLFAVICILWRVCMPNLVPPRGRGFVHRFEENRRKSANTESRRGCVCVCYLYVVVFVILPSGSFQLPASGTVLFVPVHLCIVIIMLHGLVRR